MTSTSIGTSEPARCFAISHIWTRPPQQGTVIGPPLLALIRRRLADGAVVGGTSAGAAVMSGVMIAGGDSFTALLEPPAGSYTDIAQQEGGALALAGGLGLRETRCSWTCGD